MLRRILFSLAAASLFAAAPALAEGEAAATGNVDDHACTCGGHMARHDHHAAQPAAATQKSSDDARPTLIQSDADWRRSLNGSNG